jgi:hypothetical protein
MTDELVHSAEIGRRLGVTRQRVGQWTRRPDFPAAAARSGRVRFWRWSDVERWDREHARVNGRPRHDAP